MGTRITLLEMRRLALQDHQSPEVARLAEEAPDPIALDAFLRSTWFFVPDPVEAEYVKEPRLQFYEALENYQRDGVVVFQGDCDDAATLAASILSALGYPNWFTAIRMPDNPEFEHVFTTVQFGNELLQIDPIVPASEMPLLGIAEVMEVHVWPMDI